MMGHRARILAFVSVISPGTVICRRVAEVELQNASKGRFLPPWVWYYGHVMDTFTKTGELHMDSRTPERYKVYFNTETGEWVRGSDEDNEGASEEMKRVAKFLPFQILTTGTCNCRPERHATCKTDQQYDWETTKKVKKKCWCGHGRMLDLVDTSVSRCVPMPGVCFSKLRDDPPEGRCSAGSCATGLPKGCREEGDGELAEYWKLQVARHWEKVTTIYTEESIEAGLLLPSKAVYPVGRPLPDSVWYWASAPQMTKDGQLNMNQFERYKIYFNMYTGEHVRGKDAHDEEYTNDPTVSRAKFLPVQTLTKGTCGCNDWRNADCWKEKWYDWATQESVSRRCWCGAGTLLDLVDTFWSRCIPLPWVCHQGDCQHNECSNGKGGCTPVVPDTGTKMQWITQLRKHWETVTDLYSEKDIEEGDLRK